MAESSLLDRSLRQAARRLRMIRTVAALPWCILAAATIAALLVVVGKYRALGIETTTLFAMAAAAAFVAAGLSACLRGANKLSAALELDRRCELDERISSAIAAQRAGAENSSAVAAVQADAERALAKVDVASAFPIVASRKWARPLVPAIAMITLGLWFAPTNRPPNAAAASAVDIARRKESASALEKKLVEKQKTAEALKLTETNELLEKLRDETRRLQSDGPLDKKESLIHLNDLAQRFEKRRTSVELYPDLKQQLSRLKSVEPGPAEQLVQSLGQRDFRNAAGQLQRLREQMQSNALDDEQRSQLGKQFDALQQQLVDTAQRQSDPRDPSAKQATTTRDAPSSPTGETSAAPERAEVEDKLPSANAQSDPLRQLGKSFQKAAQHLKQGDASAGQQSLADLQQQLQDLASQSDEQQLLDQALNDLAAAKAEIGGNQAKRKADGTGEPGEGEGHENARPGDRPGQGGLNPGLGTARNEDPTDEGNTRFIDSRVQTEVGAGALQVVGPADGPNAKGRALQAIREQADALTDGTAPQPVANQALDRSRRAQKREYFDALRSID